MMSCASAPSARRTPSMPPLVMAEHVRELDGLQQAADPDERLEGRIWRPAAGR